MSIRVLANQRRALNSLWTRQWASRSARIGGSWLSLHAAELLVKSPNVQREIVTTTKSSSRSTRRRKLILENLPKDVTDEEIYDFMSQLGGKIERAKTSVRVNSQSTGLGSVVFSSVRDAKFASKRLQNKLLRGRRVIIYKSERSWRSHPREARSVFVANIAPTTSKGDLITHFQRVGDVVALQLPEDENGKLLGHAFLEFVHPSQAEKAVQMLNHSTLQGRILSVRQHADDTDVVHVSRLPENVPHAELYKLFGQVGKLAYVHFPSPGRATVKYVNSHDAVKAVQVVSGATVAGQPIRVVLARERKSAAKAGTVLSGRSGVRVTITQETSEERIPETSEEQIPEQREPSDKPFEDNRS